MSGQSVVLLADEPELFERRDAGFNRRGVDALAAMNASALAVIAGARTVQVLLSKGAPGRMGLETVWTILNSPTPFIILNSGPPEELASDSAHNDVYILDEPFQDRVMDLTAKLLAVPTRHYLRILVQLKVLGPSRVATFGTSNNLSATGILLETLASGDQTELSFLLPGAREMMEARAKVVRKRAEKPSGSTDGVQFIGLSSRDQLVLHSLANLAQHGQPAPGRG